MRQILWGIKKPLHFYTNFSETLTKFYINTRRMTAGNTTSLRPMQWLEECSTYYEEEHSLSHGAKGFKDTLLKVFKIE